ncbi:MAG TPA: CHRD domain-containing protein [Gammaproteobacteria bacterium]|jgi:hypothetical protein|nr:CHRD domain-containing protein [Gammaproteobacteria bacterium]
MEFRFTGCGSRLLLRWLVAGAAWAATSAAFAETFHVRLSTVPIEAATAAAIAGQGAATAELDGTRLTLKGSFAGLKGAATTARLHEGRVTGVRGPAFADFSVPAAQGGNFTAEITLTPAQADGVRHGRVYVQIASASAPEGNLWGWLLP